MKVDMKMLNFDFKKNNGICIKQATPNNFERINKYYREINAYPWNPIQLESNFYHYIEINNKIIACGGTLLETQILAHLGNIHVNPEFRRQYYGGMLVSKIVKRILNEKQYATLFVQGDNFPAINLYKKLGFRVYKNVELYMCENM